MAQEKRKSSWKWWLIPLGAVLFIGVISISMARTSTMEYCTSCHEMKRYETELKKSSHAVDKDKNPIGCAQCHIPNQVGPKYLVIKTVFGMKDMAVHYFGDPENLDRKGMQQTARRFLVDENCRACHEDLYRTVKDKEISEIGKLAHDAYLGKNGNARRGCAGCHFNMAHLPIFDRRYDFNQKFANNLPLELYPNIDKENP